MGYVSDLLPSSHMAAALAAILVYGVGGAGVLWLVLSAAWKAHAQGRLARLEEESLDASTILAPGLAVLGGTVQYAEDTDMAVRVEVDQMGTEHESSGTWSHRWTEVDRRVRVRPFYLLHVSRARIRVEPDDNVYLVDEMDGMILVNRARRTRTAELTPGERVNVRGVLERGPDPEIRGRAYRDDQQGWVLRPPPGDRMLISSEPLGARFLARARFHAFWAILVAVMFAPVQVVLMPFHLALWSGETVQASVVVTDMTTGKDSDDAPYEYWLRATAPTAQGPIEINDEISRVDFEKTKAGQAIWARVVPSVPRYSHIGSTASLHLGWLALAGVLVFVRAIYAMTSHATLPWYQRKVVDTGSGRLSG